MTWIFRLLAKNKMMMMILLLFQQAYIGKNSRSTGNPKFLMLCSSPCANKMNGLMFSSYSLFLPFCRLFVWKWLPYSDGMSHVDGVACKVCWRVTVEVFLSMFVRQSKMWGLGMFHHGCNYKINGKNSERIFWRHLLQLSHLAFIKDENIAYS